MLIDTQTALTSNISLTGLILTEKSILEMTERQNNIVTINKAEVLAILYFRHLITVFDVPIILLVDYYFFIKLT